jgi:hypothetical protein
MNVCLNVVTAEGDTVAARGQGEAGHAQRSRGEAGRAHRAELAFLRRPTTTFRSKFEGRLAHATPSLQLPRAFLRKSRGPP